MRVASVLALIGMIVSACPVRLSAQSKPDPTAIARALTAHDFDRALALLQPAIQQFPQNPQLWTLDALALSGKGNPQAALVSFHKALRISPEYLPALEGAAQLEYEAGSQDAVPLLQHVLRLRPDDPTSHGMLAVLAYKRGDCTQAVEHFALSGQLLDSEPTVREEYSACLIRRNQPEKAIAFYQRFIELHPSDSDARHQLASIELQTERPKAAIETLAPLLEEENPDVLTLELAASAYEAAGDTPLAVTTLRRAIVLDPHRVDLYVDFAVLSMDHQSYQVGIDMVNVGLKAEPNSASLYIARGVLYVQLAKYEEAEGDFEKGDSLDPTKGIGSVARGLEEEQTNDLDRALKTVQSKLAGKPNDPNLLYLQADILTQMGQELGTPGFQTAMHSAQKAVSLEPTLVAARDLLAKLYLQAGQAQAAVGQCREALKIDPKDQTALYHLIQALRKSGDSKEIPDLLKRLADLRVESTKQEREHHRYKLAEVGVPAGNSQ